MTHVMAEFHFGAALTNLVDRCIDVDGWTIENLDNLLDAMLSIDPLSNSYRSIHLLQKVYCCNVSLSNHHEIWPDMEQLTNLGMPGELTVVRDATTDAFVDEWILFVPTNPFSAACLYFLLEFSELPKSSSRVKESVQDDAYMFHMGNVLNAIIGLATMKSLLPFERRITAEQEDRLEEIAVSINEMMLVLIQPQIFFKKHYDLRDDVLFRDYVRVPQFSRRAILGVFNLQFYPYDDLDFTDIWVEFWHTHGASVLDHAVNSYIAIHGVPPPEIDDVFEDDVDIRTNASESDVDV